MIADLRSRDFVLADVLGPAARRLFGRRRYSGTSRSPLPSGRRPFPPRSARCPSGSPPAPVSCARLCACSSGRGSGSTGTSRSRSHRLPPFPSSPFTAFSTCAVPAGSATSDRHAHLVLLQSPARQAREVAHARVNSALASCSHFRAAWFTGCLLDARSSRTSCSFSIGPLHRGPGR